ncbi:conserved hypothetical protein [Vibrio chagasii]|uniref:hypothetical protein n=1 Tax=Vibrio tubiashii TaxID=29498 RepID=UPI00336EF2E9|nr:conserved hypothetical protein [Vibrio chagasii]CAH7180163.1 conserved hypothetical protein [Vibrio chagasii]CAH7216885.1 conserved hypothetical protein [Vibrio chagasii]CAH7252689.1 conserved hypothetical protein [Vibrio chagasii]CAH7440553.1 conserved hypothetical protein [Vibrio chagasii]
MDIRCNLKGDLDRFAELQMKSRGYEWRKNHKVSPFHQYMNLLNREVTPLPRTVFLSKGLECPNDLKAGFDSLVTALTSGRNVNAYLSSNLKRASYNDGFLNDFGLHHFHLGTGICSKGKSKGFVNRTGPILIAYITEQSAYLVGIYEHGRNGSQYLWTDQNVIEVIHNQWPEALSSFKVNGISPSKTNITPKQRKALRSKSCNSLIEMRDGTIYSPIGGGITGASTNTKITIEFDQFFAELNIILKELCLYINRTSDYHVHYPIYLSLSSITGGNLFVDKTNNIQYLVRMVDSYNLQITQFINGVLPDYYPHTKPFKVNIITELIIANKN